jgi:wobble nucleotide-excising tRNase
MEDNGMLKTLRSIANIGKFVNFTEGDNVPFQKVTLIYAENGRGKTTLVDIFRSLQSGEGHYITARRTLGASGLPEVSLLLDSGTARFHDGEWDRTLTDIELFDDTFIHENVYAGDFVVHDHKKNLYQVIVGDKGVTLARKVDEFDAASRETAREIREAEDRVIAFLPEKIDLEDFMDFPRPEIDLGVKLSKAQAELKALQGQREIKEKGYLKKILLPPLPERFFEVLAMEFAQLSSNAEQAVRAHLQRCRMDQRGEGWLEQGLKYAQGSFCPFCEQSLTDNALFESYQAFFSASYRNLKSEIGNLRAEMEQQFGEAARLQLERDIADNRALFTFWRQFVPLSLPELPYDDLRRAWHELRTAAEKQLERKTASPLERASLEPDLEAARKEWTRLSGEVDSFNTAVNHANSREIARLKQAIENPDLREAELDQEMRELQAKKLRHTPDAEQACRKYADALQRKKDLEQRKKEAKKTLDAYARDTLPRYQRRITELLKGFATGFAIHIAPKSQFTGGKPSVSYDIDINKTRVGLGNEKTEPETACFKNTLSSGDRRTLALAFFLARLQDDPRLAEKIVVFDDPVTSQDDFRSAHIQKLIHDLYVKTQQLIVLSHDPRFLRNTWRTVNASDVCALKISLVPGDRSTLEKWNIEGVT